MPTSHEVEQPAETINLAKLVRLHDMLTIVSMEARETSMDPAAIERLAASTAQLLVELGGSLPDTLRAELARYVPRLCEGMTEAELRVVRAELAGWVDGLLSGLTLAWSGPPPFESAQQGS